jgi:regulatory protein
MRIDGESVEEAKAVALRHLEARMRTRREVRDRLLRRGFTERAVEQAIEDLSRVGLLDDRRYAEVYIESRLRTRPRSYALLRAELVRKGVAPALAREATAAVAAERPEVEVARAAMAKTASRFARLPLDERRRRLAAFLRSRGFGPEVAEEILHRGGFE